RPFSGQLAGSSGLGGRLRSDLASRGGWPRALGWGQFCPDGRRRTGRSKCPPACNPAFGSTHRPPASSPRRRSAAGAFAARPGWRRGRSQRSSTRHRLGARGGRSRRRGRSAHSRAAAPGAGRAEKPAGPRRTAGGQTGRGLPENTARWRRTSGFAGRGRWEKP
nr:hypothetical protein [Tanacetum cinerariifolium]